MEAVVHHPNGPQGDEEFDAVRESRNAVHKKFQQGLGCIFVTLIQGIDDDNERTVSQGWSMTKRFKYQFPKLFIKCGSCEAQLVLQNRCEHLMIGLAPDS